MRVARTLALFTLIIALVLSVAACSVYTDDEDEDGRAQESAEETEEEQEPFVTSPNDPTMALPNTTGYDHVIFAWGGENPSYHGALIAATPILLNIETGEAWTQSQKSFTEETQYGNTSKGTDTFTFKGKWDGETLSGNAMIETKANITASDGSIHSDFYYSASGTLTATKVEGTDTLKGTMTGDAILTQTFMDGVTPIEESMNDIAWTVEGEMQKK